MFAQFDKKKFTVWGRKMTSFWTLLNEYFIYLKLSYYKAQAGNILLGKRSGECVVLGIFRQLNLINWNASFPFTADCEKFLQQFFTKNFLDK